MYFYGTLLTLLNTSVHNKCLTLLTSVRFIPQLPKFNSIVNYKIIFYVSVVVNPPVWASYLMEMINFNAKI